MRRLSLLEHEDQLMFGTIKRSHTAIGLVPDAEILELVECRTTSLEQFPHMAPVHADEGDRTIAQLARRHQQRIAQKACKRRLVHLA